MLHLLFRTEPLPAASAGALAAASSLIVSRGTFVCYREDGSLSVECCGESLVCDLLEISGPGVAFEAGNELLMVRMPSNNRSVVLGRIGRSSPPQPQKTLTLEATESLTLKCGEASVELRADGRAMVKGEDVLLRAKGTQRIRAGNVAIN